MSFGIQLKDLRDEINRNVNAVLLKWNAKKVILNECNTEDTNEICTACLDRGDKRYLRYLHVNFDEAVYKCESSACLFPFKNFKYKNYIDGTIFRYERVNLMEYNTKLDYQEFMFARKTEGNNTDNFGLDWLDDPFASESELDNILASSTEGQIDDIKEIINDICSNAENSTTNNFSESNINSFDNKQSLKDSGGKLSKCLQYIEDLSPHKSSSPKTINVKKTLVGRSNRDSVTESSNLSVKSRKMENEFTKKKRKGVITEEKVKTEDESVNVDETTLGVWDWLDVVNGMESTKIQEFTFAEPFVVKQGPNVLNENKQKDISKTSPILIEIMGTSESYQLTDTLDQLPHASINEESCNDFERLSKTDVKTIAPSLNLAEPWTMPVEEYFTITESIPQVIDTNNTLDTCRAARTDGYPTYIKKLVKTNEKRISQQKRLKIEKSDIIKRNTNKLKIQKEPVAVSHAQRQKYKSDQWKAEQRKKRILVISQNREKTRLKNKINLEMVNTKRRKINIEVEEQFAGFEPLKPFIRIAWQGTRLEWIKEE